MLQTKKSFYKTEKVKDPALPIILTCLLSSFARLRLDHRRDFWENKTDLLFWISVQRGFTVNYSR